MSGIFVLLDCCLAPLDSLCVSGKGQGPFHWFSFDGYPFTGDYTAGYRCESSVPLYIYGVRDMVTCRLGWP